VRVGLLVVGGTVATFVGVYVGGDAVVTLVAVGVAVTTEVDRGVVVGVGEVEVDAARKATIAARLTTPWGNPKVALYWAMAAAVPSSVKRALQHILLGWL
jgi:hypothetical protein